MPDYQKLFEESKDRFSGLQAALENESKARFSAESELVKAREILLIHQQNADALTGAAEQTLAASLSDAAKLLQLSQIIQRAKKFGSGREAVRKLAEAEDLEAQAAKLKAEAVALQPQSQNNH
jgi:hypothetical protein